MNQTDSVAKDEARAKARAKARSVLEQMTVEEKISQMLYQSKAIERLGIPAYNWWNEALHGVARAGLATVFPQSIALAASFDKEVLHQVGQVIGREGRLKNEIYRSQGDRSIYKGLTYWSPNINIVRDPRWGRAHESYGEDPYLNATLGTAFVKGIQGDGEGLQAAACAKHFAVHSGPEATRHGFNAEVSEKDLRETYLPAFEKLVKEAKVAGVMTAYNAVNGVPASANQHLLREILRKEWGFEGYTVSDCGAISDMVDFLHYTDSRPEAAAMAVEGGCELNCGSMYGYLVQAVEKGYVSVQTIDEAVEDLYTIRFLLDMEDDTCLDPDKALHTWLECQPEWDRLNDEITAKTIVLLKNNGILPLKKVSTMAVVGPNACAMEVLEGNYHGTFLEGTTVLQGLRKEYPQAKVLYSEGSHLYRDRVEGCADGPDDRVSEAKAYAAFADVTVAVLGLSPRIEGEQGDATGEYTAGDKRDLSLPASQLALLRGICEVSDKVIVVLLSGGSLDLGDLNEKVAAVIQGWYPGAKGGNAIAGVLSGRINPTGRLPVTFYRQEQVTWDFADYSMKGKTYRYFEEEPLYPFGYGLSYEYLTIHGLTVKDGTASIQVSNPHDHPVAMPLHLYARIREEGIETPLSQLVGIVRPQLAAGECKEITLEIDPYWLQVVEKDGSRRDCRGTIDFFLK